MPPGSAECLRYRPSMLVARVPLRRKVIGAARARMVLRGRGITVGRLPVVLGLSPLVHCAGRMEAGDRLRFEGDQFRASLTIGPEGVLLMGHHVYVNQGVTIHASEQISIGDHVKLADLACVYDTDFHPLEAGGEPRVAPVTIGDNVWVGRAALVLPGATIGPGSVVAAGAVVTGDIPGGVLVTGNPARVQRQLTTPPGWVRP